MTGGVEGGASGSAPAKGVGLAEWSSWVVDSGGTSPCPAPTGVTQRLDPRFSVSPAVLGLAAAVWRLCWAMAEVSPCVPIPLNGCQPAGPPSPPQPVPPAGSRLGGKEEEVGIGR